MKTPFNIRLSTIRHIQNQNKGKNIFSLFKKRYFGSINMKYANLNRANLYGANLEGASLEGASLEGANLEGANLNRASLEGANLNRADLYGAIGNKNEIKSLQCDTWSVVLTDTIMQIGCERHSIEEWYDYSDERISQMDPKALTWWIKWKPILKMIIEIE